FVFYSFYGKPQKDLAVKAIAEAFGAGGHPNPLEATQKILQIRTALIVLDGTEEAEAGTLKQILDARGRCGILITSRTTKDAMTEWQNIVPLPTDEAVTLLAKWGQESISDNRVAQAICELVGYLPLAIRLAGHIVAPGRQSAVKFLQELQKTPLKKLHQGQRRQESVPLLLKQSLNQVTSQARQILTVSGILALAPFSPEVMVAATELSEAEIEDALEGLQDYGLLLKEGDHYHNRYQISHALIHTYANERLSADSTMFKRLVGYYAKLIEDESQDKLKGFQRLDMERSHIIQLISEGCKRQDWHGIRKLVWATQEYLSLRGYRIEQKQILDQCVRVVQHLGEQKTDKADLLNKLGEVCNALGKTKPALDYLKQALAIYETNDNPTGTASAKRSIGEVYISEAQPKPALDYLKQALAIYEINDNPTGIAFTKKGMGIACAMFGDEKLDDAVRLFNDALAICEELGDKNCIAANTGNLGNIHAERRQWIEAYKCFNVVLEFALSSGNRIQEGAALGNLGTIFFSGFEDMKMAHKRYKEALKIAIETSDLLREANLYYNIGEIHKYKQKYSKARKYLKKARKIFVKINACDGIKDCNDLLEELP
ncbi:MAG: tetratricopeptide repeat protein, partial [Chloroflexota bacterium]